MGGSIILDTGIDTKGFAAGSKKLLGAIKSLGASFGRDAKQITSAVTNMGKSFTRTIAGMFGIVGVIGILRKATNSYLAANKDLSSQMSSMWTALGNVLGPIIETIVGWITKAMSYFLSFLKLLGATSKSASQLSKSAAGAGGALQKSLMGFDELNKLSAGGGGGGGGKGLEDVEPPEWMERIVEFIKSKQFELAGRELAKKLNEMVDIARQKMPELGKKFSELITGALEFIYGALDGFDWNELGLAIHDFIVNIDFSKIIEDLGNALWAALKGAVNFAYGLLGKEQRDDVEDEFPIVKSLRKLKTSLEELGAAIAPAIDNIWSNYLKPFIDWLIDVGAPAAIDTLSDAIDRLAGYLSGSQDMFSSASDIQTFGDAIGFCVVVVLELFSGIVNVATAIGSFLVSAVVNGAKWLGEFGDKLDAACEGLHTKLVGAWQSAKDKTTELIDAIKAGWQAYKDGVKSDIDAIGTFFTEGFNNLIAKASTWGRDIIQGICNGLASAYNSLVTSVSNIAQTIKNFLGFSEPEEGPLSDFHTYMPDMIDLMTKGINDNKGKALKAVGNLAEGISEEIQNGDFALNDVEVDFDTHMGNFADKIVAGFEDLVSRLEEIAENVTFNTPAFAGGFVAPYAVEGMSQANSGNEEMVGILREIATALVGTGERNTNSGTPTFVLELDGRELAYSITQYQRRDSRARGG